MTGHSTALCLVALWLQRLDLVSLWSNLKFVIFLDSDQNGKQNSSGLNMFELVNLCKFNIILYSLILHFTQRINKCVA